MYKIQVACEKTQCAVDKSEEYGGYFTIQKPGESFLVYFWPLLLLRGCYIHT